MSNSADKILKRRAYLSSNVTKFFTGPQGSAALKALVELYCTSQLFDPDPVTMARNVAEHDLIREIERTTKENQSA